MKKLLLMLLTIFSSSLSAKTIIILRHADRLEEIDDLSVAGYQRAERLKSMFVAQKINLLFSTNYIRTTKTIAPLAQAQQLETKLYESSSRVVEKIKASTAETIIIVGHSNTVPEIVKGLTGVDVPAIADDEFDNMFVVSMLGDKNSILKLKW